jgi:serine/threonine-protein kinase RsbT
MAAMKNEVPTPDERRIILNESSDNEIAVVAARSMAAKAGFGLTDQVMFGTAVSELTTNIIRYAKNGEVLLRILRGSGRPGLEVVASDKGPGIPNIERAMEESYTTSKGSLGLGLSSVKRIMDEFEIESEVGRGTRVTARMWR